MKALLVVILWALAGSGIGGAVERMTGLGITTPILVAFVVIGVGLAVRIMRATKAAPVIRLPLGADRMPIAAERDDRLTA